jgi:hypothetical protein
MDLDQDGPWIFAMGNIYQETKVEMQDCESFFEERGIVEG